MSSDPNASLDSLYDAAMRALRTGVYHGNPGEESLLPDQMTADDLFEAAMKRLQGNRYRGEKAPLRKLEEKKEKVNDFTKTTATPL
jgi:hypothetical protein